MIRVDESDDVVVLTLDDGRVNAMDVDLLRDLTRVLSDLAEAPAIVVTGSGRAFSAGLDLRRLVDGGSGYVEQLLPALSDAFLAVFDHPRPVVAAINGHALAGGCVLAAASDVRLMSGGLLGLTELLVGVPFPIAVMEIVRFAFGPAASELALTGRTVDVGEALRCGLIHAAVEPDDLLDQAVRRATEMGRLSRSAYAATKEQLHRPTRRAIDEARTSDDARTLAAWTDEQTLGSIALFVQGLAAK